MKIATLSLNINTHDFNYGAMLHSWAFQQFLLKQDYVEHTEIINYITPRFENYKHNMHIVEPMKKMQLRKAYRGFVHFLRYNKRKHKFNRFIRRSMLVSKTKYTQSTIENAVLPYDTIICESDVIWSPKFFLDKFDKSFFLAHPSMENMRRIAYSPSLGDGLSSPEQKKELSQLLSHIDAISCRETYGVDILRQCTERPVVHVQDPVMLLEAEDYEPIIGKPIIDKPYLLLYLPVDNNDTLRQAALNYAELCGYELVEISTKLRKPSKGNIKVLPTAGIGEFLSAVKYSSAVFTNSFHAVCFSLLFKKQFYVFSRKYGGKIRDICNVYGLPDRVCENDVFKPLPDIDYTRVEKEIIKRRRESIEWINNAINA